MYNIISIIVIALLALPTGVGLMGVSDDMFFIIKIVSMHLAITVALAALSCRIYTELGKILIIAAIFVNILYMASFVLDFLPDTQNIHSAVYYE